MTRILVVDDDPRTAVSFARTLELKGYQVTTVSDADAGLRAAVASHSAYDGMILDLRMPGVDGLAFLRRLRNTPRYQNVPVVVVTGDYLIDDQTVAELGQLGAVVRFKPLWLDDLVEVARTFAGTPAA
jgi:CheY-like chemotaxis protein